MRSPLPEGFTVRPAALDDAEIVNTMYNESTPERSYGQVNRPENFIMEWTRPGFDVATSTQMILAADGKVAGFALVYDAHDVPVRPALDLMTHPAYDDGALMQWLLEWGVERARQAIPRCPPEARVATTLVTRHGYRPFEELYERAGSQLTRNFWQMRIDMTESPEITPLPAGFVLRGYRHPDDFDELVEAREAIFRDHYGHIERPVEDVKRDWLAEIERSKSFDPALWWLAVDEATGEIAGFVLTKRDSILDPEASYVELVGVRRGYRGRGLAAALLRHCFAQCWSIGKKSVTLMVDSTSSTGANRLYERAGMYVQRNVAVWELELRPGIDLMHSV